MKKICFVSTIPGSLRTFLLKPATALHETGEFEIYFMSSRDEEAEKDFPPFIHFIPIPMKRGVDLSALSVVRKMKAVFKKERFDIVQYFTPNAACYASIAAKSAKIPVRVYSQWGILYVGFHGFKRSVYKYIEKMVCRKSTCIEVENQANLDFSHAEKLYPADRGSVIWNGSAVGVPLDRFDIDRKAEWNESVRGQFGIPKEDYVFGFCGRQNKDKGLNELLEAMRKIVGEKPAAHLLLVGRDADAKSLNEELYAWAKSCPNVHFTGRVSDPEKYYAAMDCYVMPSYREGFGMTVIEAESMAVPVIASDIVGHKGTMIPDVTGVLVESHSSKALYDAMNRMMADRSAGVEMGKRGREYVEQNFEQKELLRRIVEIRKKQAGLQ